MAPTLGSTSVVIRSAYAATVFNTIISAYVVNQNPCVGGTIYTFIGCTNSGALTLSAATLAPFAGQQIYVQLMGDGLTSPFGNYLISFQGITSNISLSNATNTSVTVNIPTVANCTNLKLFWRPAGSSGYSTISINPSTLSYVITGLQSGVTYNVWCAYSNSQQLFYSQVQTIVTTSGCLATPALCTVTPVNNHCSRVNVTWPAYPDPLTAPYGYRLYWRIQGSSGYSIIATTTNSYSIAGLAINTTYEFWYIAVCANGGQKSSNTTLYTTCNGPARSGNPNVVLEFNGRTFVNANPQEIAAYTDNTIADGLVHEINLNELVVEPNANMEMNSDYTILLKGDFEINPNPAADQVTISYSISSRGNILVKIFKVTGEEVQSYLVYDSQLKDNLYIEVSDLHAGVYIVSFQSEKYTETKRLIVAR
jgi:hypothetical protein